MRSDRNARRVLPTASQFTRNSHHGTEVVLARTTLRAFDSDWGLVLVQALCQDVSLVHCMIAVAMMLFAGGVVLACYLGRGAGSTLLDL